MRVMFGGFAEDKPSFMPSLVQWNRMKTLQVLDVGSTPARGANKLLKEKNMTELELKQRVMFGGFAVNKPPLCPVSSAE